MGRASPEKCLFVGLGVAILAPATICTIFAIEVLLHVYGVAYGLEISDEIVYIIAIAFLGMSSIFAWSSIRFFKARNVKVFARVWAFILIILFIGLPLVGLYYLGKFEKGESNLGLLSLTYHDLDGWEARAATIRTGILSGANLDPLPTKTPLNPVTHSQRVHGNYSVENVYFESLPGFFVAGNLFRPTWLNWSEKKPVVLVPHGHFADGRFEEHNQHLGATLARMGAIAFTYDMVGKQESTQVTHDDPNSLTMQLWNSMRVLDFLLNLTDADPDRVAMTGASGGGTQTFLCTAIDSRVKVSAPVVMVSAWAYGGCECETGLPIHKGNDYATNNAEIAALAAPRPQLIVSDGTDWTRTVPHHEFPYIQNVYTLFNATSNVENVHFPDGLHDYEFPKREAVYQFFALHLALDISAVTFVNGTVNENVNVIETRESMLAFYGAHPMPGHALNGWDAVMAALRALQ